MRGINAYDHLIMNLFLLEKVQVKEKSEMKEQMAEYLLIDNSLINY
jgi:hypothetical protein